MASFRIGQEELPGGVLLITFGGALDANTSDALLELLKSLFERKRYRIVVDMSGMEFISSAGMSILIDANETARENGGNLVFLNPSGQVRTVMKILSADKLIPVAETRDEAVRQWT
jgi:anti-anti-sigma factor